MKTLVCFPVVILMVCVGSLCALDVAEQELRVGETVRFENNEGVPDKVETVEQIRGIGTVLGRNPGGLERSYYGRYRVLHIEDPSQRELFDADVFILESSATVDHIRNLRYIIGGYLMSAYGYSQADGDLLAQFITIYNAVYRKNMEYFGSKYKRAVMGRLDSARAGLSTMWREWPGGTQMLIPLSDGEAGPLSAIDTGTITDKEVVDELRKQDDKGIESRKDIVDLKERQIEEQQKKTEEQKQAVQEERRQIEQREKDVDEKIAGVQEQQKTAGEQDQAALARQEESLREEKAQVEEDKQAVAEKEAEIAAREARTEERKEEVREDRREIARDQEEILRRDSLAAVSGIPFIKVSDATGGRLLLIDPQTGDLIAGTQEQVVTVRSYESFSGGLAVILQREGDNSGKLSVLERGSLKEKISAREEIYPQSGFEVNGSEIFVVIRDGGKWYLGKYDANLALLARSKAEVNPRTFILFSSANVFVEDSGGRVIPLKLGDMAEDLGTKP